jgi:hypothetical protein
MYTKYDTFGYRKVLMEKSEARNMAGLVLFAVKHGLVEL